jgi:inhibitor of the pro-sigma K processing machinery
MEQKLAIEIMAGICLLVLFIVFAKKYLQLVLNFFVRVLLGAIGILTVNDLVSEQDFFVAVGLNPATLLTVGALGFGGLVMLYAVAATKNL